MANMYGVIFAESSMGKEFSGHETQYQYSPFYEMPITWANDLWRVARISSLGL